MTDKQKAQREKLFIEHKDLISVSQNHSSRIPICFLIDCYDSGNLNLSDIREQLDRLSEYITRRPDLNSSVESLAIGYSNKPKILWEFQDFPWKDSVDLKKQTVESVDIYSAMRLACDKIRRQKWIYKNQGISFCTPSVFLFSTGNHEADTDPLKTLCRDYLRRGVLAIYPITRSKDCLFEEISSNRRVYSLETGSIPEIFAQIKNGMDRMSSSSGSYFRRLMDAAEDWM